MTDWSKIQLGTLPLSPKVGGIQTPAPAPVEFTPTVDYNGGNLFAGQYEGVNTNLGVGSHISFAQQAGVDRSGRTLGFA